MCKLIVFISTIFQIIFFFVFFTVTPIIVLLDCLKLFPVFTGALFRFFSSFLPVFCLFIFILLNLSIIDLQYCTVLFYTYNVVIQYFCRLSYLTSLIVNLYVFIFVYICIIYMSIQFYNGYLKLMMKQKLGMQ